MSSHKRAAAIIIKNEKILLMHRIKNDHEYYAIPGGFVESNETPKQAAIREIKEETTLNIDIDKLLWEYDDGISYCYYFLAKKVLGTAKLSGPEEKRSCQDNFYQLKWIHIDQLANILLYPIEISKKISSIKNT